MENYTEVIRNKETNNMYRLLIVVWFINIYHLSLMKLENFPGYSLFSDHLSYDRYKYAVHVDV